MTTNPDIEDDQIDPINQEERDFLAEFTEAKINELERTAYARSLEPLSEAEIDEMMEAIVDAVGPDDVAAPNPVTPVTDWLIDVRELARKHGPFSAAHMIKIIQILMADPEPAAESVR